MIDLDDVATVIEFAFTEAVETAQFNEQVQAGDTAVDVAAVSVRAATALHERGMLA